jgi:ribosomal-protein-alanine N-acetyltransferase
LLEPLIRPAARADLASLLPLQSCCPEAAQWTEEDYEGLLGGEGAACCLAAEVDGQVAGFLVYRRVAAGELEILNLAVDPGLRRRGIGKALLQRPPGENADEVFLEVRAGNTSAQRFYRESGFREVGRRPDYYRNPSEAAIVMRRGTG